MFLPNSSQPLFGGPSFVVLIPPPLSAILGSGTVRCRKPFPCWREQIMFRNMLGHLHQLETIYKFIYKYINSPGCYTKARAGLAPCKHREEKNAFMLRKEQRNSPLFCDL